MLKQNSFDFSVRHKYLTTIFREGYKYGLALPPMGWDSQRVGLSSDGVPVSEKPARKTISVEEIDSYEGELLEAEALWDYTSFDDQELAFKAGQVILVSNL